MSIAESIYNRSDEFESNSDMETYAIEHCVCYLEKFIGRDRSIVITFIDLSTLTLSSSGYIGCESRPVN